MCGFLDPEVTQQAAEPSLWGMAAVRFAARKNGASTRYLFWQVLQNATEKFWP